MQELPDEVYFEFCHYHETLGNEAEKKMEIEFSMSNNKYM